MPFFAFSGATISKMVTRLIGPFAKLPPLWCSDLRLIWSLARDFRGAIEKCDRRWMPPGFECFPRGCCGDTTLLLGTFFKEQGIGTFAYVLGERGDFPNRHSHAWLEAEGTIVDITADQFPEVTERVIVVPFSEWHSRFERERPHEADYRIFDESTVSRLGLAYRLILRELHVSLGLRDEHT